MSVSKNILKMFLIFFIINSVLKFLKESFDDSMEWNPDLAEPTQVELDESTQAALARAQALAQKKNVCTPVGEGENCW